MFFQKDDIFLLLLRIYLQYVHLDPGKLQTSHN